MQITGDCQEMERRPSVQMRAVLEIFSANRQLASVTKSYVDVGLDRIDWEPILKFPWDSEQRAAIVFAYGVWTDRMRPRANPFDAALSLGPSLQLAVLRALAIRWGLGSCLEKSNEINYNQGGGQ